MSKPKKPKLKVPKQPRNPVALNPLLQKGGVHQKSSKAIRARAKQALRTQVRSSDSPPHLRSAA